MRTPKYKKKQYAAEKEQRRINRYVKERHAMIRKHCFLGCEVMVYTLYYKYTFHEFRGKVRVSILDRETGLTKYYFLTETIVRNLLPRMAEWKWMKPKKIDESLFKFISTGI
jgi:hypothetical protein